MVPELEANEGRPLLTLILLLELLPELNSEELPFELRLSSLGTGVFVFETQIPSTSMPLCIARTPNGTSFSGSSTSCPDLRSSWV